MNTMKNLELAKTLTSSMSLKDKIELVEFLKIRHGIWGHEIKSLVMDTGESVRSYEADLIKKMGEADSENLTFYNLFTDAAIMSGIGAYSDFYTALHELSGMIVPEKVLEFYVRLVEPSIIAERLSTSEKEFLLKVFNETGTNWNELVTNYKLKLANTARGMGILSELTQIARYFNNNKAKELLPKWVEYL